MKKNFLLLNAFLNKNWNIIFMISAFLYICNIYYYNNGDNSYWTMVHLNIFILSFAFFIIIIIGITPTPIIFLILFLILNFIDLTDYIDIISNWFFFDSSFHFLFDKINVKDSNVFLSICFIILGIISLLKLIFIKLKFNKLNFNSLVTFLTIGAFLFITFLFHYVLIETFYKSFLNKEITEIKTAYLINDKKLFLQYCDIKNYICIYDGNIKDIENNLDPNFKKTITPFLTNKLISGNFPINIENKTIYLIITNQQKWVIDTRSAGILFAFTEKWLMFSLTIAHCFWLFFYVWLLLFHNKRIYKA